LATFGSVGTCDDDTYGLLPPLPDHLFNDSFAWLMPRALGPDAKYMAATPMSTAGHDRLDRKLGRDGLVLPKSFVTFTSSDVLLHSIPDTGRCWNMSLRPVPSPVEHHAYLLQFLSDSQGCGYWYLYLGSDGTSCVVLSLADDDSDGLGDVSPTGFLHDTVWVAPDFEHFVYRFWIESVAFYQLKLSNTPWDELLPAVRDYLGHYARSGGAPLDVWPAPFPATTSPGQLALW